MGTFVGAVQSMRVLVTFAVEAEFAPWRKLRHFSAVENASLLWWSTIGNTTTVVGLTGVGNDLARSVGSVMGGPAWYRNFDVCISSGLAGALRGSLRPGEVLVAEHLKTNLVHYDSGRDCLDADKTLVELATSCGATKVATLFTADHILITAKEKSLLADSADAVDMETFTILKEAFTWGTRGVAIRGISDTAAEDLPIDFNRTLSSKKAVSIPRVVGELARKPGALPSLIKFGRQSRNAAEKLAKFLDEFVRQVGYRLTLPLEKEQWRDERGRDSA